MFLPYELLCINKKGFEWTFWYYPAAERIRIYRDRVHYDTIVLRKPFAKTWVEHPTLGRMEV